MGDYLSFNNEKAIAHKKRPYVGSSKQLKSSNIMAQIQGPTPVLDKKTVGQAELQEHLSHQATNLTLSQKVGFNIKQLSEATENIVQYAQWLACQKTYLNKLDFKHLMRLHGWSAKESNRYLKVAAAFSSLTSQQLAQVEPATIFQLANQSKKYQPVIDQLKDLPEINQAIVRGLMESQRKPRVSKQEEPTVWRTNPDGSRYAQIPPIHDQETGVILQHMMEVEGKTAQAVISEAMGVFKLYKEGLLVPVSQQATDANEPEEVTNLNEVTDFFVSQKESTFMVGSYVDDFGINVNLDKDLLVDYWADNAVDSSSLADMSTDIESIQISFETEGFQVNDLVTVNDSYASVGIIMDLTGEKACVQMLSPQGLPEEILVDLSAIALFEREEKAADGDYEILSVETTDGSNSNQTVEASNGDYETQDLQTQITTEQLINVFQHATSWTEIKDALALSTEESKLEARNVLTSKEHQRVNQIIREAYGV